MQQSFMPPCLGTCCCLGCPLPPLARLLWTFSETSSEVTFSVKPLPASWGNGVLFSPIPHGSAKGLWLWLPGHVAVPCGNELDQHSFPDVCVGGREDWDIFRGKSGHFWQNVEKHTLFDPHVKEAIWFIHSFIQDIFIEYRLCAEKAFDNPGYPFLKRVLSKLEQGIPLPAEGCHNKPTADIIINGIRLHACPPKIDNKERCLLLPFIQHGTRGRSQCNEARKRNKKHKDWKGRIITVFSHRWCNSLLGNPKESI